MISAEPEIRKFKITSEMDYILLACDGIFDKMNNVETIQSVWE